MEREKGVMTCCAPCLPSLGFSIQSCIPIWCGIAFFPDSQALNSEPGSTFIQQPCQIFSCSLYPISMEGPLFLHESSTCIRVAMCFGGSFRMASATILVPRVPSCPQLNVFAFVALL